MSSSEKGQVQGSSTGTGGERGEETIGEEEDDWLTMATGFKDAGNAAFQKGDIEEAISLYSQAIALNPDDHVYYSNRSAAYMKASSISKALHDGEKCVELKPDWGKGYNRLGVAQQGLRRFEQAVATFKIGLRLEPGNNAMWDALRACEESQKQDRAIRHEQAAKERVIEESILRAKDEVKKNAAAAAVDTVTLTDNDVLASFFSSVKDASADEEVAEVTAPSSRGNVKGDFNEKYLNQELGTGAEQHARLTAHNYEFRNLNPYWVMQLDIDATEEDIKQRYRKLSSKVHPDKNRGVSDARLSFEAVKVAYQRLQEEDQRIILIKNIESARQEAKRVWEKETSSKSGAILSASASAAVSSSSKSISLEDAQNKAVQRHFADMEMARRKSEELRRAYSAREKMQAQSEQDIVKKEMEWERDWAEVDRREKRVNNWRDFNKSANSGAVEEGGGEMKKRKKDE